MDVSDRPHDRGPTSRGYTPQSADTSEDLDRLLFQHWAALDGAEKLAMAMRASTSVREVCARGIEARHPGAGPDEVRIRVAMQLHGESVVRELLGLKPGDVT